MGAGEDSFIEVAIREGFLASTDLAEVRAARTHAEQTSGRSVPLEHILARQEWLTREQLDRVSDLARRRVLLCPSCWSRVNAYGMRPEQGVTCGRCEHRLRVPADRNAELLLSTEPVAGDADAAQIATRVSTPDGPADAQAKTAHVPPPAAPSGGDGPESPTTPGAPPVGVSGTALRAEFRNCGYVIVDCIGAGGMGTVYKAIERPSGRVVAIKLMQPQFRAVKDLVRRFFREAGVAAKIDHRNVIPVLDAGCLGGRYYIVMPFVEGKGLDVRIGEAGKLAAPEVLRVGFDVALGLAATHRAGAVHRDIKPSNILVRTDGSACIADFGLVRGLDAQFSALTKSGAILGTPRYMAPEQARDPRAAGPAADQYALGATLFHSLIGVPPYSGCSAMQIFVELQRDRVPRLPESALNVPPDVRALVERMMAAAPERRFPDLEAAATAVVEALKRSHGGGAGGPPDTQELLGER